MKRRLMLGSMTFAALVRYGVILAHSQDGQRLNSRRRAAQARKGGF